ncbi:hypothetical protein HQ520_05680, partial [bacterium]|nr:hypothetical protein [bacterium]
VRTLYVAAWHIFPQWTYDYNRLIELAHNNAIRVYAWLRPPYVHEKFWIDHPEWRERNAAGEEAGRDDQHPMALGVPEVRAAALDAIGEMLDQFPWDGVVLDRAGWQANDGANSPELFTPFHPDVRELFQERAGFDPILLLEEKSDHFWKNSPESMRQFESFRSALAYEVLHDLLSRLDRQRAKRVEGWEVIVTWDPNETGNGLQMQDLAVLKARFGLSLQLALPNMDISSVDAEGFDLVRLPLEPTASGQAFVPSAPTAYPTGLALYSLLRETEQRFGRYSINSEGSLYEVDQRLLPFVSPILLRETWVPDGLIIESPRSVEMAFSDIEEEDILIDDELAAGFYRKRLLVPAGERSIRPSGGLDEAILQMKAKARLVDFSGDLLDSRLTNRGLEFSYRSHGVTYAVISQMPHAVRIDGERVVLQGEFGLRGWSLPLPAGQHEVQVLTRGWVRYGLMSASFLLSNAIVIISALTALGLIGILLVTRILKKSKRSVASSASIQEK